MSGWQSALLSLDEPLGYLVDERGLAVETVKRYGLGWDRDEGRLIVPVYEGGELVNVLRRRLRPGENFHGLRSRGSQLYPDLPPSSAGVLLVAGIFDVLSARQARAHWVVTTTVGDKLPDRLVPPLAGRPVAVAYDVGEEVPAAATVAKLRAVGSEAWVVRLGFLGLPPGGDLNDYYRDGGTTRDLAHLIRRERRAD
jgi:hypothetical protein